MFLKLQMTWKFLTCLGMVHRTESWPATILMIFHLDPTAFFQSQWSRKILEIL